MQDVYYIEEVDQAIALLKPIRLEILRRLDEPRTCDELAEVFENSPQKIYYHVKALQEAGLVEKVAEKRIRGTVEGYYQAKARSYWLAPSLVGKVGSLQQTRDQASLRILLQLAEDVIEDTARLGSKSEAGQTVASLSLSAQIHLADSVQRAAFLQELQATFQSIAMKYGVAEDARACYALWISWFRTAHDGLILAKHSALKAIPLAIFINIHSVKRYFDLS